MKNLNEYIKEGASDLYDVVTDELQEQKKLGIIPDFINPEDIYLDEEGARYALVKDTNFTDFDSKETTTEKETLRYVPFLSKGEIIQRMYPN